MVQRPRSLTAGSLILILAMALTSRAAALDQVTTPSWMPLGPIGPSRIRVVAPSPEWPEDLAIIAVREDCTPTGCRQTSLVRTTVGGATWEEVPNSLPQLHELLLAPRLGGARVAFASTTEGVSRSADFGDTWAQVVSGATAAGALSISPAFAQDSTLLLVRDGSLQRSTDGGVTWQPLDPAPGWAVQQASFSPDYARDHTILLAISMAGTTIDNRTSVDDTSAWPRVEDGEVAVEPLVLGPGVLRSTDSGQSWSRAATGLERAGLPYTAVASFAISPTFAIDQTLFAVAAGPRAMVPGFARTPVPVARKALFRSTDARMRWEWVRDFPTQPGERSVDLALSPFFASDRVVYLALSDQGATPSSHGCTVWRSTDGGGAWAEALRRGASEQCTGLTLGGAPGALLMAVNKASSRLVQEALDGQGAAAAAPVRPPDELFQIVAAGLPGPTGRTLFASSASGLWAWGPGARDTAGAVPCATPPVGGFGRIWNGERGVRARLGCALAAEQPVSIRVQHGVNLPGDDDDFPNWFDGETDIEFWLDDDDANWYALNSAGPFPSATAWPKLGQPGRDRPWLDAPDQIGVEGAVQRFEGGLMLFVPLPDGTRTIYVVATTISPSVGPDWLAFSD